MSSPENKEFDLESEIVTLENADKITLGSRGWGSEPRQSRSGVVN